MRRTTRAGSAAAGLALILAACGGGGTSTSTTSSAAASAPAATGDLVIWADASANTAKAIEPLCKSWAEANAVGCKVQKFNSATEMRDQIIKANDSGGDLPDLFTGAHDWLGQLVTNGVLAPIDLGAKKANFVPAAVNAAQYEGQNYAVPWGVENVALLMNTDLSPECPATLDEAVATAKKLLDAKKATLGIALQIGTGGDAYHWQPIYSTDGGYLLGQNADGSFNVSDIGVGEAGSIAAAKRLSQLAEDGIVKAEATYNEAKAAFSAGKAPYMVSGPWAVPEVQKGIGEALKVCPVPTWEGSTNKSVPFIGVQQFYQTQKAPNPVLASTFLNDYVMTTEFMDGMFKGDPRPPAWIESFQKASADPIISGFGSYGQQGIPQPGNPEMVVIFKETGLAQYKVASGKDPEAQMLAARKAIDKGIADLSK